jgi:hypothetical protein
LDNKVAKTLKFRDASHTVLSLVEKDWAIVSCLRKVPPENLFR